ncbi:hypothetical protein GF362_04350 [Candidatus Dojkabacteria bacterium]|nr:hypothetical protein [Candidatus Dojkabacteria bacterium]
MKKQCFQLQKILAFIPLFLFLSITSTSAKIRVNIERTYEVTDDLEMKVTEKQSIRNNLEKLYIPGEETVDFSILAFRIDDPNTLKILEEALETVKVTENGEAKDFNSKIEDSIAKISFPYGRDLYFGESREFTLEYTHPSLVYQNGALIDVYIHGFEKNFEFETSNTKMIYSTKLIIPSSIDKEVNFINPEPKNTERALDYTLYSFDQESLVDAYIWLQLGTYQIYDFKITQYADATEEKLTGLKNRFELVIPKDFSVGEIKQEVFLSSIDPEPTAIFEDEEGNLFAEFEFLSNENHEIIIDGYAYIEKTEEFDFEKEVGSLGDIEDGLVQKYTKPAEYWEVNSEPIQVKAEKLKKDSDNTFQIVKNIYEYIVDTIDYDEVKRFGLNERQGALKTLLGGSAVCMEYSDLFISLARASNIPARAVFGYGYDSRMSSDKQEPHQWVQVYMPGVDEWIDVDVTWGESGEIIIGGDLNHFYSHTAYKNPNEPSLISRYAYGANQELDPPKFEIQTVAKMDKKKSQLTSIKQFMKKYPKKEKETAEVMFDQMKNRLKAGVVSLQYGLDLENTSQIMVLSLFVLFVVIFIGGVSRILRKR